MSQTLIWIYWYRLKLASTTSNLQTAPVSSPTAVSKPESLNNREVWVEYHPASGKPPQVIRPGKGLTTSVTLPSPPFDKNMPLWHPFHTCLDFEQAELFLRVDASNSYIDAQLKLIHSGSGVAHGITLKSAKELHSILHSVLDIEVLPGVCGCPSGISSSNSTWLLISSLRRRHFRSHICIRHHVHIQLDTSKAFPRSSTHLRMISSQISSAFTLSNAIFNDLVAVSCTFGKRIHRATICGTSKWAGLLSRHLLLTNNLTSDIPILDNSRWRYYCSTLTNLNRLHPCDIFW